MALTPEQIAALRQALGDLAQSQCEALPTIFEVPGVTKVTSVIEVRLDEDGDAHIKIETDAKVEGMAP